MAVQARPTVLHVAPHPDDELLGAPATLMALRDSGHEVLNLACGLGRVGARARRRPELELACARAGFQLKIADPLPGLSADDDLHAAEAELAAQIGTLIEDEAVELLVSPSPQDGHHAHETVARAALRALEARRAPLPRWWIWGLWADLPLPTLLVPFDHARMQEIELALAAHVGELARNDYRTLLRGRGLTARVLGPERVFGFGSPGIAAPFAELLCEVVPSGTHWLTGRRRMLDPTRPLETPPTEVDLGWWLRRPSMHAEWRARARALERSERRPAEPWQATGQASR